jgi:hypothetical protein
MKKGILSLVLALSFVLTLGTLTVTADLDDGWVDGMPNYIAASFMWEDDGSLHDEPHSKLIGIALMFDGSLEDFSLSWTDVHEWELTKDGEDIPFSQDDFQDEIRNHVYDEEDFSATAFFLDFKEPLIEAGEYVMSFMFYGDSEIQTTLPAIVSGAAEPADEPPEEADPPAEATTPAAADSEIRILFFGEYLELDQPPVIVSGRTLVPMRAIFEAFGGEVIWHEEDRAVEAVFEERLLRMYLPIGSDTLYIAYFEKEGGDTVTLDVPAQIINGRTMVPVRAISEALHCNVEWVAESRTVVIEAFGDM